MKIFKTMVILSHRYIGIPLSFVFVVWFVSAFFMIYAGGMPRITPAMAVDGMQAIDFAEVRVPPARAAEFAGFEPEDAQLRSMLGRPVYAFGQNSPVFVLADTGEIFTSLNEAQGAQLASDFLQVPVNSFQYRETLYAPDQWTLTAREDLPLFRYDVADGLGTQVYVSPDNARVSVYTTRQSRMLAWLGTIPHWFYFVNLRNNQPLWYDIVVGLAAVGCIMALLGLVLSFTQWRRVRPFSLRRAIPYQGMQRWHYITGTVFGIFTLTWVFSGLVSMEPFAWTNAQGVAVDPGVYRGPALNLQNFPDLDHIDWARISEEPVKQVEFVRRMGTPYLLASVSIARDEASSKRDRLHQPYNIAGQSSAQTLVVNADTGRVQDGFPERTLVARLDAGVDARVTEWEMLGDYDDYYYSRQGQLPLPVLRVKFDDPAASWIYVDPASAEPLSLIHRYSRIERWLYSGLHSLDFAFWYHKRPLWDLGMLVLLTGGLALSLFGLILGLRRLWRDVRGAVRRSPASAPAPRSA